MAGHKPQLHRESHVGKDSTYFVKCTCRVGSEFNLSRSDAEDWVRVHLAEVERALANLHRGKGSLMTDMHHAAAKLEDPAVSAADKKTWQIIHDSARRRLGLPDPDKPAPPPPEGLW